MCEGEPALGHGLLCCYGTVIISCCEISGTTGIQPGTQATPTEQYLNKNPILIFDGVRFYHALLFQVTRNAMLLLILYLVLSNVMCL